MLHIYPPNVYKSWADLDPHLKTGGRNRFGRHPVEFYIERSLYLSALSLLLCPISLSLSLNERRSSARVEGREGDGNELHLSPRILMPPTALDSSSQLPIVQFSCSDGQPIEKGRSAEEEDCKMFNSHGYETWTTTTLIGHFCTLSSYPATYMLWYCAMNVPHCPGRAVTPFPLLIKSRASTISALILVPSSDRGSETPTTTCSFISKNFPIIPHHRSYSGLFRLHSTGISPPFLIHLLS